MPEITDERLKELEDAATKANALEAKNSRLEEESGKFKTRAQTAEAKLGADEEQRLKDEGKTNELLLKSEQKNAELTDTLTKRTKSVLNEKVRNEISKFAKDAHDVDMILRVKEHKDLLKINEEELTVTGVEDFIGKVRETHSYLFGTKRMPDYDNKKKDGKGDDDEEQKDDDQRYLEELKKVDSRKDLIALKKKYNKPLDSYHSR